MTELPVTDPKLIAAIADRDRHEQWEDFEKIYRPALFAALRRQGLHYADAEDCCQRILLKLLKGIRQFADDGKPAAFRRWLFRIAKNESISYWRHLASHPQILQDSHVFHRANLALQTQSLDDSIELEYQRHSFRAIAKLVQEQSDPRHWQAFWNTTIEGRPTPQVAKELNMSVGAVYVAKGRILKLLQAAAKRLEVES